MKPSAGIARQRYEKEKGTALAALSLIVDTGKVALLKAQFDFLNLCKVGLYTASYTWTHASVFADLTEAFFAGYARQPVTWADPFLTDDFHATSIGSNCIFLNGGITSEDLYGWFLLDPTETFLVGGGPFNPDTGFPDSLGASGSYLVVPSMSDTSEF